MAPTVTLEHAIKTIKNDTVAAFLADEPASGAPWRLATAIHGMETT